MLLLCANPASAEDPKPVQLFNNDRPYNLDHDWTTDVLSKDGACTFAKKGKKPTQGPDIPSAYLSTSGSSSIVLAKVQHYWLRTPGATTRPPAKLPKTLHPFVTSMTHHPCPLRPHPDTPGAFKSPPSCPPPRTPVNRTLASQLGWRFAPILYQHPLEDSFLTDPTKWMAEATKYEANSWQVRCAPFPTHIYWPGAFAVGRRRVATADPNR